MRRSAFERRLRDGLHAAQPPRAAEAERRAWHVVAGAHAGRPAERRNRTGLRLGLAFAAAVLLCALLLTPAGARVGDWIGDVVSPAPEDPRPALVSLPARGRLLVMADGGPWIVRADGARRQLAGYRDATWSPGGRFVAATRGRELTALEPDGVVRWTRVAAADVSVPRWSPDGYRIAYRSAGALWVVVGDNSGNWLLDRAVRSTPPAWRPRRAANRQELAYARGRRVRVVRVDPPAGPRAVIGQTPPGPVARELWWTPDGQRLLAVSAREVRIHGPSGRLVRRIEMPRGLRVTGSALSPDGRRLALIAGAPGAASSRLLLLRTDRAAPPRRPLADFGPLEGLTWSMDGRVLVVGLPRADQWLFLRMRGRRGLVPVESIRSTFSGGRAPRTGAFPRPAGWCYARGASEATPCSGGG